MTVERIEVFIRGTAGDPLTWVWVREQVWLVSSAAEPDWRGDHSVLYSNFALNPRQRLRP